LPDKETIMDAPTDWLELKGRCCVVAGAASGVGD
jgi:hypothetical protein